MSEKSTGETRFDLDPDNPPRMPEERMAALRAMTDQDIDVSDIPPQTGLQREGSSVRDLVTRTMWWLSMLIFWNFFKRPVKRPEAGSILSCGNTSRGVGRALRAIMSPSALGNGQRDLQRANLVRGGVEDADADEEWAGRQVNLLEE